MAGETPITIVGNLTADAEQRLGQSGTPYVTMNVAVTPRVYDRNSNSWKDGSTDFYEVVQFGRAAENAAASFRKGDNVIITGTTSHRRFERNDGSKGMTVQIKADAIGMSTTFATVSSSKHQGAGGYQQPQAPAPQQNAAPQQAAPQDPFLAQGADAGAAW